MEAELPGKVNAQVFGPAEVAKEGDLVHLETVGSTGPNDFDLPRTWSRPPFTRLRWQLPLAVMIAAILPPIVLQLPLFYQVGSGSSASNTFAFTFVCSILAVLLFRRLERFPGINSFAQIAPSVAAAYGLAFLIILTLRIDYSRPILLLSAVNSLALLGSLWFYYRRQSIATVYLLPGTSLSPTPRMRVHYLSSPLEKLDGHVFVAADLKQDHAPAWQKFILNAALAGIPVFDAKILEEASTGKVEIEHLSENTFGSVLPSVPYLQVKRLIDVAIAVMSLPVVLPIVALVALAIRLDSPGKILFKQRRIGFRGVPFTMYKFRTMRPLSEMQSKDCSRSLAMTKDQDVRITGVGRFLRKHRIDELPQIFNILRGEMSWIGPRPEAEVLGSWYAMQVPFYGYRHMVRPGITGWAQVSQGHVVEVDDIRHKLYYDFFYIKNFSAWLDALIVTRTLKILLLGVGAK
jgi:lipopolysaccharide/colanic/teichoic acid biosynthesis glycosyltransferase